jgi:hypothetical protein
MDHLKYMRESLNWIIHLREISLTYKRWFKYQDEETGQRFCPISVALQAELHTYRWHLIRWIKKEVKQ